MAPPRTTTPSTQRQTILATGTYLAYGVYLVTILLGGYLIVTDPTKIAPVVIQIAGAALILGSIIEIIVTYSNRK